MSRIAPLSAFDRSDIATAGGKVANLGELIAAGVRVPDGFVITTPAYDDYLRDGGAGVTMGRTSTAAEARALFTRAIDPTLGGEILAAYRRLGGGPVAVRSSATAEDLADASFAGQQDTFLNVLGDEALLDSVRRCWASLWTDRAVAYRLRAGVGEASLAVVVQRLVDAEAAGIMFTANPANGRRDEVVINASFGLGEAVVGGEVTPDELVVVDGEVTSRTTADKRVHTVRLPVGTRTEPLPSPLRTARVLTDAQAVALADLGRRIAAHFGAPQDIEWVLAGGVFQIVQSRPVTALPEPAGPPPTTWPLERTDGMYMRASIVEQLPDPLSPLFADLARPGIAQSLREVLARYFDEGMIDSDDMDFPTINGYGYYFYSYAGMRKLFKAAPKGLAAVFAKEGDRNGISLWRGVGLPQYRASVDLWADRAPGGLPAPDLLAGAGELVTAGARYYTYVQAVIPQAATAEIAFTKLYDTLVRRKGRPPALAFLLGADSEPIRAERSLAALARWCRETPGVAEAVLGDRLPERHRHEYEERLASHLARFGHLTYNLDVMQPVAADDPAPVLAALKHAVSGRAADPDERTGRLLADRASAEAWLRRNVGPVRRTVLMRTLKRAREVGPLREDALADIGLGWPTARRLLLELGRRFTEGGLIRSADDVFWLTLDEAARAARSLDDDLPIGPGAESAVEARKARWRGRRLVTPPGWLPTRGLYYRMFRRMMPSNEEVQSGPTLRGLGASGGTATGPARLLRGPEDFARMRPGDVLVAPITTPAYTPFFAMAAAVVTDVGGPLSHSSIVAREYGIPAVLGTGSATARIRDGDTVTVDGDKGVVLLP